MSTDLAVVLNNEKAAIQALAPKFVSVDRMLNLAVQAISRSQDLSRCSTISIVKFCKTCAEWGTDRIGAGGVWPVAFKTELVAIPDWRFLIQKSKDAKAIKDAFADAVYANEKIQLIGGMYPNLIHEKLPNNRGDVVGVYCVIVYPDDTRNYTYMEWSEIEVIRDRAPAGKKGPWSTDPIQMGLKTVIKRALKPFEGASPELTKIMQADNSALGYIDAEVREPIPMPTALPPAQTKTTATPPAGKTTGTATKPPAKQEEAGEDTVTIIGNVEKVFTAHSKKDDPKLWTRFDITVEGTVYGTFSEDQGDVAKQAGHDETPVEIVAKKNGKYWNIVTIKAVSENATVDEPPEETEGSTQEQEELEGLM